MSIDLSRRLAALESKAGTGHDRVEVILRTFVAPSSEGPVPTPLKGFTSPCGWRIERKEGESRDNFIARAKDLVPRPSAGRGIAVLREVL